MSGECDDCGNAFCICSEIAAQEKMQPQIRCLRCAEVQRIIDSLQQYVELATDAVFDRSHLVAVVRSLQAVYRKEQK